MIIVFPKWLKINRGGEGCDPWKWKVKPLGRAREPELQVKVTPLKAQKNDGFLCLLVRLFYNAFKSPRRRHA